MKREIEYELITWKQKLVSWLIIFGLLGVLGLVMVGCGSTSTASMDSNKSSSKIAGHQLGNSIVTMLTGTTVGGATGTMISKQMDRQASELRSKLKGAKVVRYAEGILVTIDTRLLFEEDSYELQSTKGMLKDLARILEKYPFTNAVIEGHTDNTGEEIYNQSLSENRAHEIENYLIGKGIKDARMKTRGYGEQQPIATNDTEAGRKMNRRIEIGLFANDEVRLAVSKEEKMYTALKQ
jgi:outer membrane protein OmpA-like peptidoglycan-associated protein